MFLLQSEDQFLLKSISSLLEQKKISHILEKNKNHFCSLKITKNKQNIELLSSSKIMKIETPTTVSKISKSIFDLFIDFALDVNEAKFYPLKQILVFKNKETFLGDIHFKIFSQLVFSREKGADKIELYKNIWPSDKELQLNKLDTHLTNLKNHLKDKINFEFSFYTRFSLIHISID